MLPSMKLGQHWLLTPAESEKLAKRFNKFLGSLPKSAKAKWIKKAEKYFPAAMFFGALASITYPRVMLTVIMQQTYAEQKTSSSDVIG